MLDLLTSFKLMSHKYILDIANPFEKTPLNIMLNAPSPIKVSVDLVTTDVLLERIKALVTIPLHGISIPTLDALIANINKHLQVLDIAPGTKVAFEKLIKVIPYIHAGFTSYLSALIIVAFKLNSLKSISITILTHYKQFATGKKEYSCLFEKVLELQDAVITL